MIQVKKYCKFITFFIFKAMPSYCEAILHPIFILTAYLKPQKALKLVSKAVAVFSIIVAFIFLYLPTAYSATFPDIGKIPIPNTKKSLQNKIAPRFNGIGPRFNDNNPVEWAHYKPWQYPIHGTDISKYQGEVNWQLLKNAHISFVFIKATEGGDHKDDYFLQNWQQAKKVNIPRGAYHFYYFCRSARDQAYWFIKNVPKDKTALPPVLDMEWNHKSPSCKLRPDPATVRREMKVFLDIVERHYGKRPIIYTTVDFFDENNLRLFKTYPFWLRSVAGHPSEKYGPHPFTFWQYTGTGIIPGIKGNADINIFAGTREQWLKWIR